MAVSTDFYINAVHGSIQYDKDTIRYGRFTCTPKLMRWPA